MKRILSNEPVLKFYDPEKSTWISADASNFGLGAVLLQLHDKDWQPVAYASRGLTSAKQDTLKLRKSCPMRIKCMMMQLQKYDVNMNYTPGKYMFAADTLSRAVDKNEKTDETGIAQIKAYVDMIVSSLPVSEERREQIRKETEKEHTLKETILRGWPEQRQTCPAAIQDYWMCRTELTVVDGIIYKGNKFVIPPAMRKEMLQKIHEGHLGEEKCKRRAREVMYWPRMNTDISHTTASCEVCLTYRPKQQAEPLMPHQVPKYPYYKVGVDLFDCNGKNHIVVTDYFSNYPEVATLQSTTSRAVIAFLKTVFARHRVPNELFSDNGPQFSSCEFEAFAKEWGFNHHTSSPNYPRSNGLAESSVKIIKGIMKKAHDGNEDFHKSLLIYRSAPLQNGLSPAQMLMGRRIRTNLPMHENLLKPKGAVKVRQAKEEEKVKQKKRHDKSAKPLPYLKPGDRVRLLDYSTGTWTQQGLVQQEVAPRSYLIQTDRGSALRRNRVDIRLQTNCSETVTPPPEVTNATTGNSDCQSSLNTTDSGLTVPSSPAVKHRPSRMVKPPERLIESC